MGSNDSRGTQIAVNIIIWAFIASLLLMGLLQISVALGIIPTDPASIHGPRWLLALIGFMFTAAGVYVLQLAVGQREDKRWTYLFSAGFQTIIAIATGWIAYGAGTRHFEHTQSVGTSLFSKADMTESYGRIIFGVACVFTSTLASIAWVKFIKYQQQADKFPSQ